MSRPGSRPAAYHRMKNKKIDRTCLRCENPFMADGRLNRLCPKCTNIINISYSNDISGGAMTMPWRSD